jgi:hypothetical protein
MIREKPRGFGAIFWHLIGFMIFFLLENACTNSTSSWTGGAFGPPWTCTIAALGASPKLGLRPLWGSRSPAKGAGTQWRGQGTIWRPHLALVGDEDAAG